MTLDEAFKAKGSPYTVRRVRGDRLYWWLRDRLGDKFEIVYEYDTVIAELRDSKENVHTICDMLNRAHAAGMSDMWSILELEKMNEASS